jgi:hypothetical protein
LREQAFPTRDNFDTLCAIYGRMERRIEWRKPVNRELIPKKFGLRMGKRAGIKYIGLS